MYSYIMQMGIKPFEVEDYTRRVVAYCCTGDVIAMPLCYKKPAS